MNGSNRKRRDAQGRRLLAALLLALVGHAIAFALLLLASRIDLGERRPPRIEARPVALRSISSEEWARNRGESSSDARAAQAPKPEEPKRTPIDPHGQVVAVAPGNNQESPDAKYVAETSNRVEKETAARDRTPFYKNPMPQRTTTHPVPPIGSDEARAMQLGGNLGKGVEDRAPQNGSGQKPVMEVPDVHRQQQIAMRTPEKDGPGPGPKVENRPGSAEMRGNAPQLRVEPGAPQGTEGAASAGKAGLPGLATLLPSKAVMDQIAGGAAPDRLQGVDEGEGTYLNTREWKYAGFFNRVKQAVAEHWDPGENLERRDPTGEIYGHRDRYTIVDITIDASGQLRSASVAQSSGLDFLDLEAVQAVKKAAPFPNPPQALLAEDSTVTFPFGFMLQLSGSPQLRFFRQSN